MTPKEVAILFKLRTADTDNKGSTIAAKHAKGSLLYY